MSAELRQGGHRTLESGETRLDSHVRLMMRRTGELAALPLIALVRFYQVVISPLTPPTCRYYPSCSSYAVTALRRFGPLKGSWLAIRRVLRCHPWAPGGVDHVPLRTQPSSGETSGFGAQDPTGVGADASSHTPSDPAHLSDRPTPRDKGLS